MEEDLIVYVRNNPILYDPSFKDYRNHHARKNVWDEIGKKIGVSGDESKEMWNKLRNAYTNAVKRRKTKSGQAAKNLGKWKYEDQMSFVASIQEARMTYGDITCEESIDDDAIDIDDNSVQSLSSNSSKCIQIRPIDTAVNEVLTIMNESRQLCSKHLETHPAPINQTCANNETEMFFLSLARNVTNLSREEQIRVKMEVSSIVFQAELRDLKLPTSSPKS